MEPTPSYTLVASLDIEELRPYRTLRRPAEHIERGIFVAEGEKVVRRLLQSDLVVESLLVTPEWFARMRASPEGNRLHNARIYIANQELLETIVGFNLHQGIMAIGRVPAEPLLDRLLPSLSQPRLLVGLDGLVHAENVGVVVRNCAAFGAQAVVAGETSSSPYLRRAVRNSMGSVFSLPIIHSTHLAATLADLRDRYSVKIIAAHPHGEISLSDTDLSGDLCFIFGNEGEGISASVLEVCTIRASLPMMNGIDSVNVASASAVFLYAAAQQRRPYGAVVSKRKD